MSRKVIVRKFDVYVVDLNREFTSAEDMTYQLFDAPDVLVQSFLKKEVKIEWDEGSELNKMYPEQDKIEELLK